MKAIVQDSYGSTDVLELKDVDPPVLTANDVLIRVHAAGLDRGVWHVMTGLPYLIRFVVPTLGVRKPKVPVLFGCRRTRGGGRRARHTVPAG